MKMKSYASVEEIDRKFTECELEMIPVEESKTNDFFQKRTEIVDIPTEMITDVIPDVGEGDIIVVVHTLGLVEGVCYKDDSEKKRRVELIRKLSGK